MLKIDGLKTEIEGKEILKGIDLSINKGEIHVLMGPNGSGKSTLAQVLMGHPRYEVSSGSVEFLGKDLLDMEPDERSLVGLFLSFQYPSEVEGVSVTNYLRMIYNKRHDKKLSPVKFRELLREKIKILGIEKDFMSRYLNEGFSGGEKKKMEMLQMLVLEPRLAILDEVDSGLDIDAVKVVADTANYLHDKKDTTLLVITHYTRILKYIDPDHVHVMQDGVIVSSGGSELADELEEKGYAPFGE
jgi:Fe-S cluster assembly ATP-binding protein